MKLTYKSLSINRLIDFFKTKIFSSFYLVLSLFREKPKKRTQLK